MIHHTTPIYNRYSPTRSVALSSGRTSLPFTRTISFPMLHLSSGSSRERENRRGCRLLYLIIDFIDTIFKYCLSETRFNLQGCLKHRTDGIGLEPSQLSASKKQWSHLAWTITMNMYSSFLHPY